MHQRTWLATFIDVVAVAVSLFDIGLWSLWQANQFPLDSAALAQKSKKKIQLKMSCIEMCVVQCMIFCLAVSTIHLLSIGELMMSVCQSPFTLLYFALLCFAWQCQSRLAFICPNDIMFNVSIYTTRWKSRMNATQFMGAECETHF